MDGDLDYNIMRVRDCEPADVDEDQSAPTAEKGYGNDCVYKKSGSVHLFRLQIMYRGVSLISLHTNIISKYPEVGLIRGVSPIDRCTVVLLRVRSVASIQWLPETTEVTVLT